MTNKGSSFEKLLNKHIVRSCSCDLDLHAEALLRGAQTNSAIMWFYKRTAAILQ